MVSIIKKECRQFFSGLMGFIIIGLYILANGVYLFFLPGSNILDDGYASLDSYFTFAPFILLFLIPAITMRSFSDEYRNGTFEILQVSPVFTRSLVLGKFIASLVVTIIAVLLTLIYVYSISVLSAEEIDLGGIIGSYIGLFMLCGIYSAIGIFVSSLQDNPVISFLITAVVSYLVYSFFGSIAEFASLKNGWGYVISMIGMKFHYDNISKGFIDTRDMVYFLSLIVFLLFMTIRNIQARKSR